MCGSCGAWVGRAGALLLVLALIALASAHVPDKRADMSPMPFVMGSRYGRSSPPKLIAPRNDRFFMGSRYGKRSEGASGAHTAGVWDATGAGGAGLLCEYTGVFPLYRCIRHDKDHYDTRSAHEAGERDEE